MFEAEPSGVRLVFKTTATAIALGVLTMRRQLVGVPSRPPPPIEALQSVWVGRATVKETLFQFSGKYIQNP
jgi:hypothetical protein